MENIENINTYDILLGLVIEFKFDSEYIIEQLHEIIFSRREIDKDSFMHVCGNALHIIEAFLGIFMLNQAKSCKK